MNGDIFLDTNILVYLFSCDEPDKRKIAIDTINQNTCITGINNINELANVLMRKFKVHPNEVIDSINQITQSIKVVGVNLDTIKHAIELALNYKYTYYDSLVIASALGNNCTMLYSEDLHHQHVINETLTIINIFK